MRRAIYFVTLTEDMLKADIAGFSDVIRGTFADDILLPADDMLVFTTSNNGYLVTGSVYGDGFDIPAYLDNYDVVEFVIHWLDVTRKGIKTLRKICKNFYAIASTHRGVVITVATPTVFPSSYVDDWADAVLGCVAFFVCPSIENGVWCSSEPCSGSYDVGNMIWHIYAGRHYQIEDLCFSGRRACEYTGLLLARTFNVTDINELLMRRALYSAVSQS